MGTADAVGCCGKLSGARTGPMGGPVQAFRVVFACMGPAGGPVQALAFRCGYRTNLICTGSRLQDGAFEYKSRKFDRYPPDF